MTAMETNKIIKVELYKSAICPRCMYVAAVLREIQQKHPQIEITAIDIATNLWLFRKAGVTVFPAIIIGTRHRAWIVPDSKEIWQFVESALELE